MRLPDFDYKLPSIQTRPDARLPKSRAGGQEQWQTSHTRIAHGQSYPMPSSEWSSVPNALLWMIKWRSGVKAEQQPQKTDVQLNTGVNLDDRKENI